jgi:DNA invertase Pin-like site-specific DNA recombinase
MARLSTGRLRFLKSAFLTCEDSCGVSPSKKLLVAATSAGRPFDCILIDDSSRLTRKLADARNLYDRLTFAGIRAVAVSQGVDTDSPQAELLIGVHGLIDAVCWRELAEKTHRGMQGRALEGLATGGRCFGYRTVKNERGAARLVVNAEEAQIVRRIFEMSSRGLSLRQIAWQLNADGIASPQPQKGRVSRSWCTSSVRTILTNERYLGRLVWNKKRKIRVPGTNRRVYRRRPESEWVKVAAPSLRIVTPELWAAVRQRFKTMRELWGRGQELERKHEELHSELARLREEKQRHEAEIARLVEAIATGKGGSGLTEAIAEREKKIREIMNRLVEPGFNSLQEKLDELKTFAVSRLTHLRKLLSKPTNVHEAHSLLAERFGKFTLLPIEEAGNWSYTAKGSVDLFGEGLVRVGGAGGPDCTVRAVSFCLRVAA